MTEEDKSQDASKDDVGIVVDGNLPRRCKRIGHGDTELSYSRACAGAEKDCNLLYGHRLERSCDEWNRGNRGKCAKEEDDESWVRFIDSEFSYAGIGDAGSETAYERRKGGKIGTEGC